MTTQADFIQQREQLQARCARQAIRINELQKLVDEQRVELVKARRELLDAQSRIEKADAELAQGGIDDSVDREAARRHHSTLHAFDSLDSAEARDVAFHEWRANGYHGDCIDYAPSSATDETAAEAEACGVECGCASEVFGDCVCVPTLAGAIASQTAEVMQATGMTAKEIGAAIPKHPDLLESHVADGPIATRFDEPAKCNCPRGDERGITGYKWSQLDHTKCPVHGNTAAMKLHAAQIAAREHVVPHIRAAAEAALVEGRQSDCEAFTAIAMLIDGAFDPAILRYGEAFLRFVRGSGT